MWSVRRVATAKSSLVFSAGRGGRHRIRFSGHQKNPLPLLSVLRHSPCAYFSTTSLHTDGDGDDDNATNQRTDLNTRRKVDDDSLGSLSTIELDLSEQVREILSFHDEIEDSRVSQRWNREYGYTKRNNRQVSRATKANVLLHGDGGDDDNLASGIEQESSHGCLGETSSDSALFSESFVSMDEPASPVFGGLNESESATKEWLQEGFDQEKPKEDSADLIPENAVLAHTASACFDEEVEATKDKSNAEKPFILGSDYASIDQQTAPLHSDDSLPQNQLLVSAASDLGKDQNSNSWVSTSDALLRVERDPMDEDSDFKLNRNSIAPALALLRTMNQQDWSLYDGTAEDADVMEDQFEDEFAEEAMQISSENEQENTQDSEVPIDDANCLDNFQHLLARAKVGAIDLQTAEYNAILARLAVASELDPDEISVLLMNVYWQMTKLASDGNQDAAPNSDTYEILLLTLSHRLGSIKTAADLVKSMIENRAAWTPETLVAAMHVLERRTLLDTAMEMLYNVVDDSDRIFKVPNRAFHSLLNMTKSVDAQDTALEVIQVCIKETRRSHDPGVDGVVVDALHWPPRNKRGQAIDITQFLENLIGLLETKELYTPGTKVWSHFAQVAARGASHREDGWELVRRSFRNVWSRSPSFYPDHRLLKHGLDASNSLRDPSLAVDLILRLLDREKQAMSFLHNSSNPAQAKVYPSMKLSPNDILRGIEICIDNGEPENGRAILDKCHDLGVERLRLPILHRLYSLILKGYGAKGDPGSAETLLHDMAQRSLQVREIDCGAVMHGYAVARDDSGAADFLARLEAGEFSVSPGRSCYGGLILAYIRSHAWSDALSTYEIMKREKIAASAPTNHGLVLSAYRKGGRSRVELIVEDIVDHDGKVGQKTCILALSLLLPEMGNVKGISLREVQRKIREFGAETGNEHAIELCRSLRIAEVEQHRATEKDHDAWKLVLKSILSTSKAQACAYL